MKRVEIYDKEEQQVTPVAFIESIYSKNKKPLSEILEAKVESSNLDENTSITDDFIEINPYTKALIDSININRQNVCIYSSKWIFNEELNLYEYSITDEFVKEESLVNLYIDKEYLDMVSKYDIIEITESFDKVIKIYSKRLIPEDITCDYIIQTSASDITESLSSSKVVLELKAQIAYLNNLLNNLFVGEKNNIIDKSNWVLNDLGLYEYIVEDNRINSDSIVDVHILPESIVLAYNAEIQSYTESYLGKFRMYSKSIPEGDIKFNYVISNPYYNN